MTRLAFHPPVASCAAGYMHLRTFTQRLASVRTSIALAEPRAILDRSMRNVHPSNAPFVSEHIDPMMGRIAFGPRDKTPAEVPDCGSNR